MVSLSKLVRKRVALIAWRVTGTLPLGQLSMLSSWYCGSYLPFWSYPLFTVKLIYSCWCHPGGSYGSFHYLRFYEGIYNMYLNIEENIKLVPCIASKKDFLSWSYVEEPHLFSLLGGISKVPLWTLGKALSRTSLHIYYMILQLWISFGELNRHYLRR